jgi:hypothetical protein
MFMRKQDIGSSANKLARAIAFPLIAAVLPLSGDFLVAILSAAAFFEAVICVQNASILS